MRAVTKSTVGRRSDARFTAALTRSQQVALRQIGVHVHANGVHLSGQVYTRREYEFTERIAEQHSAGLPVNNEIRISAETTNRLNK